VYGVVSTADAASSVPAPLIGISLGLYLSIYIVLLTAYISVLFHLMHKASKGELDGAIGTLPTHDTAEGARA